MMKRKLTLLFVVCMLLGLSVPAFATSEGTQIIELYDGTAVLSYNRHDKILLPVGKVTKVTDIENNVLVNNKYDGPWQETCIDGTIVYCESGAEIKIAEPYNYSDDSSMYEFRFYFGSIKPAEISRYHNVQLPDSIDTSEYSGTQVERITGDICLVEYWNFEGNDAGDFDSPSTSFGGTHRLPDGTYYVEMIGAETQKGDSVNSPSAYSYPSAQFIVVVGETSSAATTGSFSDVLSGAYYADAVDWAVEKSITGGTTATTFSPNNTCSNAHILTFLWRANGSPESTTTSPFTDIQNGAYYYGAALWAAEEGLVSGTSFNANEPCTRAKTMEFMWKAAGSPNASYDGRFTDVSADTDYAQAVAWAVENGVTGGTTATTFSPDNTCTRGQIVTFLYRAFAK